MAIFNRKRDTTATNAVLFEIWGQRGWPNVEVVGESNYQPAIQGLLPRNVSEQGQESAVTVQLVHEPDNKYDRNAVVVRASTGVIGYLNRADAARYAPALAALQENGRVATTNARVWGRDEEDWETGRTRFIGSVTVDLPEPHLLAPANHPPHAAHSALHSATPFK